MVKYLIHRPIAVMVTYIAICIIGLVASGLLPVSMLPDIKIPEITISVIHPNTNAHDLERGIVSHLRMQLMQVPGLDDMQSETRDNSSVIRLKFTYGSNIDHAFIEVNDKVDAAMARMPREVRRPKIIKASASDLPVFYVNIGFRDSAVMEHPDRFAQLSEFSSTVIRKRLEQLPEVALVDMSGITTLEIFISPVDEKMTMLRLSFEHLRYALEQNNINIGGITIREGALQYSLVYKNELRTVDDVGNILINAYGQVYKLKDLAEVGLRQQEQQGLYLSDGNPAICMAIIKTSNAQLNEMKKKVEVLIQHFRSDYPDIDFKISQDQTFLLSYSLGNLRQNLLQGCLLAILVMFLFIRDYRSPLIIAITLPVTLIISLLCFFFFNISINIISLSGLILGVGMMIDNSIIVIDNIIQHRQRGVPLTRAIADGTNEVIAPMISATLTTCAVFIPLIFLSGIAGALFYDQALAIAIGQGASLLVSITFAPVIFNLAHHSSRKLVKMNSAGKPTLLSADTIYLKGLNFVFRYKGLSYLLVLLLIVAGAFVFIKLDKRQLPELPQHETICHIVWNEPLHASENHSRTKYLLNDIKHLILQSNAFIGEQQFILNRSLDLSPSETVIYLSTPNPDTLKMLVSRIAGNLRTHYPQAGITFRGPNNPFMQVFSGQEEQLLLKISSGRDQMPDLAAIEQLLPILKQTIPGIEGTVPTQMQYRVVLDREMLAFYQVEIDQVYNTLQIALNSFDAGTLKSHERLLPIVIGSRPRLLSDIINSTHIKNKQQADIPLQALVKVETAYDFRTIYGGKDGVFVPVPIKASFAATPSIITKAKAFFSTQNGLDIKFSGSFFRNRILLSEMIVILLISVLLLYFILAAQFESLTTPWIILLEIPIDLAFALIILFLAGSSINIMSLIGFVVMGGVIINDSILKIDTINHLYRGGMELTEAIKEGGHRRLKPIIMTSLTTILAIAPQMFGSDIGAKLQLPLSLSILGGLTMGTLVSLYFIPLAYYHLIKAEKYLVGIFRGTHRNIIQK